MSGRRCASCDYEIRECTCFADDTKTVTPYDDKAIEVEVVQCWYCEGDGLPEYQHRASGVFMECHNCGQRAPMDEGMDNALAHWNRQQASHSSVQREEAGMVLPDQIKVKSALCAICGAEMDWDEEDTQRDCHECGAWDFGDRSVKAALQVIEQAKIQAAQGGKGGSDD